MNISIVGTGYVGLVTGVCLAELGNRVICIDSDKEKIAKLRQGVMPIYEPGLKELAVKNKKAGRISFSMSIAEGVKNSEIIFIAVGTPPRVTGETDLSFVAKAAREIAESMDNYRIIVDKSTVPVETGMKVAETIKRYNKKSADFDVVSNPEFLREGSAVHDTLHPERIVIGVNNSRPIEAMRSLYKFLNAPIIITDIKSAEIIKHACNSFLAMKISYINAVADICERSGADVKKVAEGMGLDSRIGRTFLNAGIGYGGNCFPKDVSAFIKIAEKLNYDFKLLKSVEEINIFQRKAFIKKIEDTLWVLNDKVIAVLGLAFKPNTDDMRNAPSVDIIKALQAEGASIKAYDPQAVEGAKKIFKDITFAGNMYDAAEGADALVILTEWDEFKNMDLARMRTLLAQPIIIDGRNIFSYEEMERQGFIYKSVGVKTKSFTEQIGD